MYTKTFFCLILMCTFFLLPGFVSAEDFGPEEWQQYRMKSDKNAVFDNGSDPLESQVYETADEVRATPVVVGDRLFVGNHNSGDLFAFDIASGEEIWRNQAPNWIHSEMIYQDGTIFVGYGNRYFQDNGIRGTGESGVLALDAGNGDILWKYVTEGEVMPTPVYYDGAVYAATGDRHLYKLEPDSGELLHKAEIGSTVSMSAPNITDDQLFVGGSSPSPYTFSAYYLTSDEFAWQTEFPEVIAGLDDVPPAVADDLVITTAIEGTQEEPEHKMYAMDTETGELAWEASFGVGQFVKNNKSGAPIIYEDMIYVGSPITKTFYAFDLDTGEKQWEFENEVMKAPPVAQDGVVYFSNAEGFIYALDAESGEALGEKQLQGVLAPAGPIIVNNTMFIGSQDSNVYAVPIEEFGEDVLQHASKHTGINQTMVYTIGALLLIVLVIGLVWLKRRRQRG
ncbi:outer membrane protein assembly factor BamB family protein [Gracilibacillus timonensis]|uniref:outer membrane protein assembly factor BamB family protein n=1 Tax=Gracilibacillus timonensis TaxID=1816696 RepID=UPI0008248113|nr:PQQ-binding-like beta-propeller repeat protein [Gracilibacillus timonensis]